MDKLLLKLFGTKRLGALISGLLVELLANPVINFLNANIPGANITPDQVEQMLLAIPAMVIAYIAGDTARPSAKK